MGKRKESPFEFAGFHAPTYTQVPDALFDELLPVLSGAELKILLYILRRTFGFKKAADSISYRQMLDGIVTHDGRRLDHGAGIKSRSTVAAALKGLEEKQIIIAERRSSQENGQETTVYRPNMGSNKEPIIDPNSSSGDPEPGPSPKIEPGGSTKNKPGGSTKIEPAGGSKKKPAPSPKIKPAPVQKSNPQETDKQNTEQQQVVAVLCDFGLSEKVAATLVKQFGVDHIREKIAYLAFMQKSRRDPIKRPAGWLRQAIEQDYSAPDGFEQFGHVVGVEEVDEDKVEPAEEETLTVQQPERVAEEGPATDRVAQRQVWGWEPADEATWVTAMAILETTLPTAQLGYFAGSDLLTTQAGKAIIEVASPRAQAWMTARYRARLVQTLRQAGAAVDQVDFVTPAAEPPHKELLADGIN